jgi:uncharacterized protein YjbI with pentapeptide repeats
MGRLSRYSRPVTVLDMESRLRRVLRWLGFTRPNGRVGAGTPSIGTPVQAMDSMARKGQQTNWARCADLECLGASAEPEGYCLAHLASHLDDADFAARLESLVREEILDARGVHFTEGLLERLLGACRKNEAQPPVFERVVRFDQAIFKGKANFEGAIFRESAIFDGATFKGMAEFGEAIFEKDAGFHGATFEGLARFSEATFVGFAEFGPGLRDDPTEAITSGERSPYPAASFEKEARFRGTKFKGLARFTLATFVGFAEFGDNTIFEQDARFRATRFKDIARFTLATFEGLAEFEHAIFEKDARFRATTFHDVARFSEATFTGFAEFGHATVTKDARFRAATFERVGLGPLIAKELVLDGAVFRQRPELEVATADLSCHGTCFLDGAYLRLRWAKVVLEDSDFAGPSILTGAPDFKDEQFRQTESEQVKNWPSGLSEQPCIASLRRANVSGLALSNVDLSACLFEDAHNLDKLRLEVSPKAFSAVPQRWGRARTKRQLLFEECDWRNSYEDSLFRQFFKHRKLREPTRQKAREVANIYRSLRKGREDNKDEPGAADFYYGEMEMRRKAAPTRAEWLILFLYWFFSGYALRAWRALVAFAAVVALFAVLFHIDGFRDPRNPFASANTVRPAVTQPNAKVQDVSLARQVREGLTTIDNWVFAAGAATAIISGPEAQLTKKGRAYRVALRIIGPLLLALAVLSVRGRVKR